jgi:hypothetical protein
MRNISISILAVIAVFLSFTASAQVLEEGTLSRIKDRPQCLGFFVPDGEQPIPGILVSRDGGYFLMFHESQAPGLSRGDNGYFCLTPSVYYGSIASVAQEGVLKFVPVDGDKLNASDSRLARFGDMSSGGVSVMYAAVPTSAGIADNGNLQLNYQLLPVKKVGDSYRIHDFLYTHTVPMGVYPLFGRTPKNGAIVVLGYLDVVAKDKGNLISILPQ